MKRVAIYQSMELLAESWTPTLVEYTQVSLLIRKDPKVFINSQGDWE